MKSSRFLRGACIAVVAIGLPLACSKKDSGPPPPGPDTGNMGSIRPVTPIPGAAKPASSSIELQPQSVQGAASVALVVYRRTEQGGMVQADAKYPFRSGDKVRFGVSSSQAGHLYLLMKGSSGRMGMLYPDKRIAAGTNAVEAGKEIIIPTDGWFSFDKTSGVETVFAFYSSAPNQMLFQSMEAATGFNGGSPDATAEASVLAQIQKQSRDLTLAAAPAGGPQGGTPAGSIATNAPAAGSSAPAPGPYVMSGPGELVGTIKLSHE